MNKADKDKVIAALETIFGEGLSWREIAEAHKEALSIMRGLAEDAEPVRNVTNEEDAVLRRAARRGATIIDRGQLIGGCPSCGRQDCFARSCTSPQAAQTEAHGLESLFSEWFDSTPHGEPSPRETFEAGYQAGRAGSKP